MLTDLSVSPTESLPINDTPPNLSLHYSPGAVGNVSPHSGGSVTPCDADAATLEKSCDGDSGSPSDLLLIQTPLQLGKTLIIYHPHAQHPPEIVDTATLSLAREPQPSLLSGEPWAPFSSCGDFEQAELFIKHNCTNWLINDQLALNQKQALCDHGPDNPPLMKNAREMHRTLEEAGSDLDISSVC